MSALLNEASPNKIKWDRHSSLTDRTQRSAKAFKLGLRGGSRRHFYASCCQGLPEFGAELGIAIVQPVATAVQMSRLLECRVASCLAHPTRIRMICDSSDGDPSAVQVDEK